MVGLGSGARSYTAALHYSHDYAVGSRAVQAIIGDYLDRDADRFASAETGFQLDPDEQRRRWLLKSLLRAEGVDRAAYRRRFATAVTGDFPQLAALGELGWLEVTGGQAHDGTGEAGGRLRLTAEGLAYSDAIGPWLFSERVRAGMDAWEAR